MQSQVLRGVVQFLIYRIENEYLSILFQIILGGGWLVERSLLSRNLFKYYILLVYRQSRWVVFDLPPVSFIHTFYLIHCGDLQLCYTIYVYWKVVLFWRIRIMYTQERKREMTRILILIFLYNFSPLSFTFEISYEQSWIHTDLHI